MRRKWEGKSHWLKAVTRKFLDFAVLFFFSDAEREFQVLWCLMKSNTGMRVSLSADGIHGFVSVLCSFVGFYFLTALENECDPGCFG